MYILYVSTGDDLPTTDNSANDADSGLSDVEQEGYCDDSRSAPELRLRLKTVKRDMEALYKNTDEVIIIYRYYYSNIC